MAKMLLVAPDKSLFLTLTWTILGKALKRKWKEERLIRQMEKQQEKKREEEEKKRKIEEDKELCERLGMTERGLETFNPFIPTD